MKLGGTYHSFNININIRHFILSTKIGIHQHRFWLTTYYKIINGYNYFIHLLSSRLTLLLDFGPSSSSDSAYLSACETICVLTR